MASLTRFAGSADSTREVVESSSSSSSSLASAGGGLRRRKVRSNYSESGTYGRGFLSKRSARPSSPLAAAQGSGGGEGQNATGRWDARA
eukprot:5895458-Pleurochrysis_carterae.AAC.2